MTEDGVKEGPVGRFGKERSAVHVFSHIQNILEMVKFSGDSN